jgi:hypothetical protein
MKNLTLLFITLCFLTFSCKKDSKSSNSDCVNQYITDHGLTAYTGQQLDCEGRAYHFKLDGIEYFQHSEPCMDYFPEYRFIDCDGNSYCDPNDLTAMNFFRDNAEHLGMIGFR